MNFRKGFWVVFLMSIGLLMIKCKKDADSCERAICTTDFRTVNIKIQDSNGNPAVLDKMEAYVDSVLVHTVMSPVFGSSDQYVVADDKILNKIGKNKTITLTLKFYKNSSLNKTLLYTVKTDCCHVAKESGDELVVID